MTVVLGPLATIRQWLVPAALAVVFGRRSAADGSLWVLLPLIIGVTVVSRIVLVMRTRWEVDESGLTLRTGLLKLATRSIPFDRIQNVDLIQPLIPRIMGLAEVKVETAGAAGADISLAYLSLNMAQHLRTALGHRTALPGNDLGRKRSDGAAATGGDQDETWSQDDGEVLVATTLSELVIAGATSNRAGALAVAVGIALQYADELGLDLDVFLEGAVGTAAAQSLTRLIFGALLLILLAVVIGWVVSIFESVFRFHEFQLIRRGPDLEREYGLLDKASASFPLDRIQSVRIERTLLRRALGFASVWADTAGSVTDSSSGGVVAPLLRIERVQSLVDRILPGFMSQRDELKSVSRFALRRGMVRASIPVFLIAASLLWLRPSVSAVVLVVGVALAWWYANRRYRSLGYLLGDLHLHARSGVFTERQWLVPRSKIQSVSVTASYFQRRLGIATLRAHTAGARSAQVVVMDVEADTATSLADSLSVSSAETAFASDGV